MESQSNLLIIGDDLSLVHSLKNSPLISSLWAIHSCRADEDLLPIIKRNEISVVLVDIDATKRDKILLLRRLKKFDPLLDVIIIASPSDYGEALSWINQGATDYMSKPAEAETIALALDRIVSRRALRRETFLLEKKLEKKYHFQGMISRSPEMLEIFHLIEKISKYFSSVLITGETGTGKEMIARAIHNLSLNKQKKLVICDCASIPENLFESELFGYVRGAFTGADKTKKGLFEEADGGIIFLDEIAEIPVSIQAKLLRVLENREFRPLGSNENKTVSVRVIAATGHNLRECVANNTFRKDLFHRLNKVEIHLPPLRERREDIPLLVRYFLGLFRKEFYKEVLGVSRQVQKTFLKYDWPGNVRELANVLESATVLAKREFIDLQDLSRTFQETLAVRSMIPFIGKESLSTLDNLEKEYISYVLKTTQNNMRQAAKILGVSRTTLYNKLAKYNLPH